MGGKVFPKKKEITLTSALKINTHSLKIFVLKKKKTLKFSVVSVHFNDKKNS